MVLVIYNFYNIHKKTMAEIADLIPLDRIDPMECRVRDRHYGGDVVCHRKDIEVLRLSSFQRWLAEYSLQLKNLSPTDFIVPITVHGYWKQKKHQGIAFATYTYAQYTGQYINTRNSKEAEQLLITLIKPKVGD